MADPLPDHLLNVLHSTIAEEGDASRWVMADEWSGAAYVELAQLGLVERRYGFEARTTPAGRKAAKEGYGKG